jgi:hypothetical protein
MKTNLLPKRMTIPAFNAAVQARGMAMELVKGNGYLYWASLATTETGTQSEMIFAFNQLTPDEWMERALEAWPAFALDLGLTVEG